jgi:hypothetical protein
MRPIKTLTPVDLAIRGLFLAAVAIGGLVGQGQRTSAAAGSAEVPSQAVMSSMVTSGLWPRAVVCQSTDAATAAPASATQPASGYLLRGRVRSRAGCTPVGGATIEFWRGDAQVANGGGQHASLQADVDGAYRLHCDPPAAEAGGRDYIYLRVSAEGYTPVIAQYQPKAGRAEDWLDIVLEPEE